MQKKDIPIRYFCVQCEFKCKFKGGLKTHNLIHTGEKPYACNQCDYKSSRKDTLKVHYRIHTGEMPYSCDECIRKFRTKSYLNRHKQVHHTREKVFRCDQCDYRSAMKDSIKNHSKIHTGEQPYSCGQCALKFPAKQSLNKHKKEHDTGKKEFRCEQCNYNYSSKTGLSRHINFHKSVEKHYSCDQCEFSCSVKHDLFKHRITHISKTQFSCSHCHYKCSSKIKFEVHTKKYKKNKLFACAQCGAQCGVQCGAQCGAQFSSNSDLIEDDKTHGWKMISDCDHCEVGCRCKLQFMNHSNANAAEKPVSCNQCDFKSLKKSNVTPHARRHISSTTNCAYKSSQKTITGRKRLHVVREEKSATCDQCGFKCSRKSYLAVHIKCHTAKNSFACDQCNYISSLKSNLLKHLLTHDRKVKQYSCSYCHYKCSSKITLEVHKKMHTGLKSYSLSRCPSKIKLLSHDQRDFESSPKLKLVLQSKKYSVAKPSNRRNSVASSGITEAVKARDTFYCCDRCDCKCSTKEKLYKHHTNHGNEKPYSCDQCSDRCSYKSNFVNAILTKEKSFTCGQCDYTCADKKHLYKHHVKHASAKSYSCVPVINSSNPKIDEPSSKRISEKSFSCDQCVYNCSSMSRLLDHGRRHTGEKPFSCHQCQYKCSFKSNLRVHLLTHEKDKPRKLDVSCRTKVNIPKIAIHNTKDSSCESEQLHSIQNHIDHSEGSLKYKIFKQKPSLLNRVEFSQVSQLKTTKKNNRSKHSNSNEKTSSKNSMNATGLFPQIDNEKILHPNSKELNDQNVDTDESYCASSVDESIIPPMYRDDEIDSQLNSPLKNTKPFEPTTETATIFDPSLKEVTKQSPSMNDKGIVIQRTSSTDGLNNNLHSSPSTTNGKCSINSTLNFGMSSVAVNLEEMKNNLIEKDAAHWPSFEDGLMEEDTNDNLDEIEIIKHDPVDPYFEVSYEDGIAENSTHDRTLHENASDVSLDEVSTDEMGLQKDSQEDDLSYLNLTWDTNEELLETFRQLQKEQEIVERKMLNIMKENVNIREERGQPSNALGSPSIENVQRKTVGGMIEWLHLNSFE